MSEINDAVVPLDRDVFLRTILRELSGSLQDLLGVEETASYISVAGGATGEEINRAYKHALSTDRLDRDQVAQVLIALERRIEGDFYIVEQTDDRIILGNRRCPFGDFVKGRPSLCMTTSNVIGAIAAQNLGYAGVELKETIAEGHAGCLVVVHLRPSTALPDDAREYFEHEGDF